MIVSLASSRRHISMPSADPATAAAAGRCLDWLARRDRALFASEPDCAIEAAALEALAGWLAPMRAGDAGIVAMPRLAGLPDEAWGRVDLLPALIAARVATDRGPGTSSAGRYLQAVSEIDRSQAAAGSRALLALAFGRMSEPGQPDFDLRLPTDLDRTHADATAALAGTIELESLLGRRSVSAASALRILIGGAAMACLRRYDLLIGMRLLRAANYLQSDASVATGAGLRFVRALQRDDGGFGDFAGETLRCDAPAAVVRFRLDAAVAFAALWTLAELGGAGTRPVAALLSGTHPQGEPAC